MVLNGVVAMDFWVQSSNEVIGPYKKEDIVFYVLYGRLTKLTNIYCNEIGKWVDFLDVLNYCFELKSIKDDWSVDYHSINLPGLCIGEVYEHFVDYGEPDNFLVSRCNWNCKLYILDVLVWLFRDMRSDEQWWIGKNGESIGPISTCSLGRRIYRGDFSGSDFLYNSSVGNWLCLVEFMKSSLKSFQDENVLWWLDESGPFSTMEILRLFFKNEISCKCNVRRSNGEIMYLSEIIHKDIDDHFENAKIADVDDFGHYQLYKEEKDFVADTLGKTLFKVAAEKVMGWLFAD